MKTTSRDQRMLRVLAAIGQCVSYADLKETTGLPLSALMNTVGYLRRRGYVEHVNEEQVLDGEIAFFRRTHTGDARLQAAPGHGCAEQGDLAGELVSVSMVERALRAQPALARVWGCAATPTSIAKTS